MRSYLTLGMLLSGLIGACAAAGTGSPTDDDDGEAAKLGAQGGGGASSASGLIGSATTTGTGGAPTTTTGPTGAGGDGGATTGSSGGSPATGPTTGPTTTTGGGPMGCVVVGGDIACDPVLGECNGPGSACDLATDAMMATVTTCFPPPNTAALGAACDNAAGPFCMAGLGCLNMVCTPYCCSDADCAQGMCQVGGFAWSTVPALAGLGLCQ